MRRKRYLVCGVMSGTSLDGIDAALVRVTPGPGALRLERVAFVHRPFPAGVPSLLLRNSARGTSNVEDIARLNILMGELIADTVQRVARRARIPLSSIDLVGSHGHTICHLPSPARVGGRRVRATLQIGDPSVIAARTGIPTVGDFRVADMAQGGQGAPLVPLFDWLTFRSPSRNRLLLNIGGIANVTYLPAGCGREDVVAFDTGPGNMVVDGLMRKLYSRPFDRSGRTARSGAIVPGLLRDLLRHPFFRRRPPKSAGREEFGERFLRHFAGKGLGTREDRVATASFLTPLAVYASCSRFIAPPATIDDLIVSGGGARNRFFLEVLSDFFGKDKVKVSDEYGIPAEEKEAICFAVLGLETYRGKKGNLKSVTGATEEVVLGKLCFGRGKKKPASA